MNPSNERELDGVPPPVTEPSLDSVEIDAIQLVLHPHPTHHAHHKTGLSIELDISMNQLALEKETNQISTSNEASLTHPRSSPVAPILPTRRLTGGLSNHIREALILPESPFTDFEPPTTTCVSETNWYPRAASSRRSHSSHSASADLFTRSESTTPHDGRRSPVVPFVPVVPLLQQESWTPASAPSLSSLLPSPKDEFEPREPPSVAHFSLTRQHLLQLACQSISSSGPSSAASSAPCSPDFAPSPSPSNSSSLESFTLHTPDSPTWRPSTFAYQTGMELSARRRARESIHGKESVARMRLRGLSSRAAQAATHSASPIGQLLQREYGPEYWTSGDSDSDTRTPSPCHTPRRAQTANGTNHGIHHQRIIKPLMSSQGHLNLTALMFPTATTAVSAPITPSNESTSSIPSPSSSTNSHPGDALPRVDPEVVLKYLTPLSSDELHATIQPIRTLLPVEESHTTAAPFTLSRPTFSIQSVPTLSNLHLSLLLCRVIARTNWRKAIPSELLLHTFSFLDLDSLLLQSQHISKYWSRIAKECLLTSAYHQNELLVKQARLKFKAKMKMYRRLTLEDMNMMKLVQP